MKRPSSHFNVGVDQTNINRLSLALGCLCLYPMDSKNTLMAQGSIATVYPPDVTAEDEELLVSAIAGRPSNLRTAIETLDGVSPSLTSLQFQR